MSRTLLEGREERKQKEALVWETWINSQQAPALLLSVVIKELAWSQLSACSCDGAEGMAAALLPGQIRLEACLCSGWFSGMTGQAISRAVSTPWTMIPASLLVKYVPMEPLG